MWYVRDKILIEGDVCNKYVINFFFRKFVLFGICVEEEEKELSLEFFNGRSV